MSTLQKNGLIFMGALMTAALAISRPDNPLSPIATANWFVGCLGLGCLALLAWDIPGRGIIGAVGSAILLDICAALMLVGTLFHFFGVPHAQANGMPIMRAGVLLTAAWLILVQGWRLIRPAEQAGETAS